MVPMEEELKHVRDYLEIEKARFEDKLEVTYDLPETMDIRIPTLILQPIVENAVDVYKRQGFIRDTAGARGMQQAEAVQYARPEIIGLVLGSFLISVATKEYRSTAGSSPMIRFVLGMIIMIGALVFLGCPLRMVIRMSAGDLNAWVALIGFILGIATGVFALKKGFSLGRAYITNKESGAVISVIVLGILILALFTTLLKSSETGPRCV